MKTVSSRPLVMFRLAPLSTLLLQSILMGPRHDAAALHLAPTTESAVQTHMPQRVERRSKLTPLLFPPIDEHLVEPEVSRVELINGREVVDVGSLDSHADAQALTGFLLAAHVLSMYVVATELLTRVSDDSDFATDVCIRQRGIDPETQQRYLEELSFEIVNTQSMSDVTDKAKNLSRRGVRRVFAIFVKTGEICEWSKMKGEFVRLDTNAMFQDQVFVRPIAIKALVDSTLAEAENEVAKALIAKKNPELMKLRQDAEQNGHKKGLDEGHKKGLEQGLRQAVRDLCDVLAIEWTMERNAEVERLDASALSLLRERIKQSKTWV